MKSTPTPPTILRSPIPVPLAIPSSLAPAIDTVQQRVGTSLEAFVRQVLAVRSPVDFYEAERAVHQTPRETADALVGAVLHFLVADPRLVEPCRRYQTDVAAAQGEKLQSNGYKRMWSAGGASALRTARGEPRSGGRL